jgi:hypothetical protein
MSDGGVLFLIGCDSAIPYATDVIGLRVDPISGTQEVPLFRFNATEVVDVKISPTTLPHGDCLLQLLFYRYNPLYDSKFVYEYTSIYLRTLVASPTEMLLLPRVAAMAGTSIVSGCLQSSVAPHGPPNFGIAGPASESIFVIGDVRRLMAEGSHSRMLTRPNTPPQEFHVAEGMDMGLFGDDVREWFILKPGYIVFVIYSATVSLVVYKY